MLRREISNLPLWLALTTSVLYVVGLIFSQGFFTFWKLEESLFPLSLERTLFQGFVAYSYISAWSVLYLLVAALVTNYIAWASNFILGRVKSLNRNENIAKKSLRGDVKTRHQPLKDWVAMSSRWVVLSMWVCLIFTILVIILFAVAKLGYWTGERHLDRIKSGSVPPLVLTHSTRGKMGGHVILCSAQHCAFYSDSKLYVFPLTDIKETVTE